MNLSRAKFDELTRDLVEKTAEPVTRALKDAGITASELGQVLLVGGSTRIPAVQEEVKNRVEQTKRQVDAKMMQGANELRNAALTVLANPSPSAPGSPPGVRSGNLRRNWNMYSSGGGGNGIFGIQSGMHYSGYLEHGTSKMAARPYVEKIKETAMPEILALFSELGG